MPTCLYFTFTYSTNPPASTTHLELSHLPYLGIYANLNFSRYLPLLLTLVGTGLTTRPASYNFFLFKAVGWE